MAQPILQFDRIVKRFPGVVALDEVSFDVMPASVHALVGENGAGKSTLGRILAGIYRPDGGRMRVLGLDPVADAARLRPRVGIMLQDGGLPGGARTVDLLEHVARLHAHPHRPRALLDLLGLTDSARTTVRRLSGGQRARLALAVALEMRLELEPQADADEVLDREARRKAERLVGMVQGSSALEGQGLDEATRERMIQRTVHELRAGSKRKIWAA